MKSNFLKTVLPAFALMLAITASLAFSPAEKNMEEDVVWLDLGNQCFKIPYNIGCKTEGNILCTAATNEGPKNFYGDSTCSVLLYKPE